MEMFLTILAMSIFALAIVAAAFGAATRPEQSTQPPKPKHETVVPLPAARFFTDFTIDTRDPHPHVPVEALLLQIENHIRLEHAAAESFVVSPSSALLHSKTVSRLIQ
ncbi:MAG: hypothetical protein JNN08_00645 [Bryobacterales bacterium]|nr:hypothetical protein [Bryobacterales bacterium]